MTPLVRITTDLMSLGTLLLDLALIPGSLILIFAYYRAGLIRSLALWAGKYAFWLAFLASAGGFLGSMFYSEIAYFPPCILCWLQRALLYPQVLVFAFAIWQKKDFIRTTLVLSGAGFLVSLYQSILQLGGPDLVPCGAFGPSCAQRFFVEYGYITIPVMSLSIFALLILLMLYRLFAKKEPA